MAIYYVDASGESPGGYENFSQLFASEPIDNGDIIEVVANGTIIETNTVNILKSLTIRSFGTNGTDRIKNKPVINLNSSFIIYSPDCTFIGLNVYGYINISGSNFTMDSCYMHNSLYSSQDYITIKNSITASLDFRGFTSNNNIKLLNNTIVTDQDIAVYFQNSYFPITNVDFINNIIYNTREDAIGFKAEGLGDNVNVNVKNCCIYNMSESNRIIGATSTSNNIFVNPLFIDTGDFHLQPSSPCINAGADTEVDPDIPTVDFDGVVRPQDLAWDIGAYELAILVNTFNSPTAVHGQVVKSTIDKKALINKIQRAVEDPYFDEEREICSVMITYSHQDGRQKKNLLHDGPNLTSFVSWSATARDGTWEKSGIQVWDWDGASVKLNRSQIGTGEDIVMVDGTMNLPV